MIKLNQWNDPRPAFTRHDLLLALLLGGLYTSREVQRLVSRSETNVSDPLDPDDPLIDVALGLISLGRTLERWAAEAAVVIPDRQSQGTPGEGEDNLRKLLR